MGGALKKILSVGATAAGTAIGGPVGGAIGSGLAGVGTSLAGGNSLGQSLVAGGLSAAGQGISGRMGSPISGAPPISGAGPRFEGIPSPNDLSIDQGLAPPNLLDTLRMRRKY